MSNRNYLFVLIALLINACAKVVPNVTSSSDVSAFAKNQTALNVAISIFAPLGSHEKMLLPFNDIKSQANDGTIISGAYTLPGTFLDAEKVPGFFKAQPFGFQTETLLDVSASLIKQNINSQIQKLNSQSTLLIYYSGHSLPDGRGDLLLFSPGKDRINEVLLRQQPSLDSDYISFRELLNQIKKQEKRPGRVIVLLDSCYSGLANELSNSRLNLNDGQLVENSNINTIKGIVVQNSNFTTTTSNQQANERTELGFELLIMTAVDSQTSALDSKTGGFFSKAFPRAFAILKTKKDSATLEDFVNLVSDITQETSNGRRPQYAVFPEQNILKEKLFPPSTGK